MTHTEAIALQDRRQQLLESIAQAADAIKLIDEQIEEVMIA
jgi:hypothetical protein